MQMTEWRQIKGVEQSPKPRNNNYGSPPWNTGATLRCRPLRRDFLEDCC